MPRPRPRSGSLGIPSADEDAERIALFISKHSSELREVYVTLDTHARYHVAHPAFWVNAAGDNPGPFTTISLADVQGGVWLPSRTTAGLREWVVTYLGALEGQGRFQLTVWPPHCLVGTNGHCVRPVIAAALQAWETANNSCVSYVLKGNNSYTEHYSAIRAEVERVDDPNTALNVGLLAKLKQHEKVYICGQAKSHCVNFTVRDLAEHWAPLSPANLVVLEDACSSVVGFEPAGELFIADMRKAGLTIASTVAPVGVW